MANENLISEALTHVLTSASEPDRDLETANVVDGLFAIARAITRLAEVVEGNTAIDRLAAAVEENTHSTGQTWDELVKTLGEVGAVCHRLSEGTLSPIPVEVHEPGK
jgi:hypothetical protein